MFRALLALWVFISPAWADGLSAPIAIPPTGQAGVAVAFPWQSSGGGVCSQATTFLTRISGLSGTQTSAYQNLICGIVTDGTRSLMDALYVFATNRTTTANLTLVSTSFGLTKVGTETFTANAGYAGDGLTGYFTTGYNTTIAGGNWTQNSASMGDCTLTNRSLGGGLTDMGVVDATTFIASNVTANNASGNLQAPLNDSNFPSFATSQAQGSDIISRTSSAFISMYINGSLVSTPTDASSSPENLAMSVGAYNGSGTPGGFDTDQLAYVFFVGGLTSTQVGNVYSRLHTFLVAVVAPSGC
jgi:hypothetical protein